MRLSTSDVDLDLLVKVVSISFSHCSVVPFFFFFFLSSTLFYILFWSIEASNM